MSRARGRKIDDFDQSEACLYCNSSLNSQMATKWCTKRKWHRRGALLFVSIICRLWGYVCKKIDDFEPNSAFPDSNWSLNQPMATKLFTKLEVASKEVSNFFSGSSVKFQAHRCPKLDDLAHILAFLVNNWNFNSWMAMQWHA